MLEAGKGLADRGSRSEETLPVAEIHTTLFPYPPTGRGTQSWGTEFPLFGHSLAPTPSCQSLLRTSSWDKDATATC